MTTGPQPTWQSTSAWRELLAGLTELESTFLEGSKAVEGEQAVAEGYRFLATIMGVAFDHYLFAEPTNPSFVDVNTPTRRDRAWGGDNTDAYYSFTTIDPTLCYRVFGDLGDSDYSSLTIYNEPAPGAWSDKVIGVVRDTDLPAHTDGEFSFLVGPACPQGYSGLFVELTPDARVLFTRDYQVDPVRGRRATWSIETTEPASVLRHTDADTAERLRSALRWMKMMFAIVPMTIGVRSEEGTLGHNGPQSANEFAEPYQVPDANFGWSARDACYGFGSFVLEEDEALVITHRPPDCRFWNVVIWNQFMAGHSALDERSSLNYAQAAPNSDGTVTVVIARRPLKHPNAISTLDHPSGLMAFRWFLPDVVPGKPVVHLVKASEAPESIS